MALIDSFIHSETTLDLSSMQLKSLSLYMEQRTSVLLSSHQGINTSYLTDYGTEIHKTIRIHEYFRGY